MTKTARQTRKPQSPRSPLGAYPSRLLDWMRAGQLGDGYPSSYARHPSRPW